MATEPVVPVLKEGPPRAAPASPLQAVEAQRIEGATAQRIREELAAEVPVAMQYNNRPHAVMLATPADLEDFAVGFALTERIVTAVTELKLLDIQWTDHGVALEMQIPAECAVALLARDRNLTGRTGCGLCGTATLEAAIRPVRRVSSAGTQLTAADIWSGMRQLSKRQPLNAATGSVHAAGMLTADGTLTVREDVGRHNAIDKAAGAVLRAGQRPEALLVTSRASYEVVHKAAEVGCTLVAAISAPTALALQLAQEAGVTLVGWTREPRLTLYCGALRTA
jgi:formate dehydrogenase accessory protein FdhD